MGTIYSSLYTDVREHIDERAASSSVDVIEPNTNPTTLPTEKPETFPAIIDGDITSKIKDRFFSIGGYLSPSTDIPSELYVITGDTVIGYTRTFEDARRYVNRIVDNHLIGHIMNGRRTERVEMIDSQLPAMSVYNVTIYETQPNFFFGHRNILCQYSIWRTSSISL